MNEQTTPHERQARQDGAGLDIRCAVLTVSDTRTHEDDESGDLIMRLLDNAGHLAIHRSLVPDEPAEIERELRKWIDDPAVNIILTTGGTGIARRDNTIDVVRRLITIELEGFGELFRMLSWQEVNAAAMLSRAVGGLIQRDVARTSEVPPDSPSESSPVTPQDFSLTSDGTPPVSDEVFIFAMPGSRNAVRTAMKQLIIPQLPHLMWERTR